MTGRQVDPEALHSMLVDALEPIVPDWPNLDALTKHARNRRRHRMTLVGGFVTATSVAATVLAVTLVSPSTPAGPAPAGPAPVTAPKLVTTPTAPLAVPVVMCPTTAGVNQPASVAPTPPTTVATTAAGAAKLAAYVDRYASLTVLAPRGWTCAAIDAADGNTDIFVVPPGASAANPPGPFTVRSADGIHAVQYPACASCKYELLCPVMPDPQDAASAPRCFATPPSRERRTAVSPDVVAFIDPPHVAGNGAPSGGPHAANGVILRQPDAAGQPALGETCTLPNSQYGVCTAALTDFVQRYTTSPAPTTESCAAQARHRFIAITSATVTNTRLILHGNAAQLVCGGPDDSSYRIAKPGLTITVSTRIDVTVIAYSASGIASERIPATTLPQYLRNDHSQRIFQVNGPTDNITSISEIYHP